MEQTREIDMDLTGVSLGGHEVLVLRPKKEPVIQTYQKTAEEIAYALQQSALRDGVRKALGYIDAARSTFAQATVMKGKPRDRAFVAGQEVLERSLRDLCEAVGVPFPDFPQGVKDLIAAAKEKKS